jgi:bloom syndrome protein
MPCLRALPVTARSIVHGTSGTRLLYITPEKVARSDVLMRALNQLQQQHRLDRVVVDEAHCVSQVRHNISHRCVR